jgi:hypothetical protein
MRRLAADIRSRDGCLRFRCRETRTPIEGMPPRSSHPDPLRSPARRVTLARLGALVLAASLPVRARGDAVTVKRAELRVEEDELLLSAEFDFALTPTLEEALVNGIPLYFVVEFELTRTRWYWFQHKVAQWAITYRVSYNTLTRQYRVASGPLGQAFETLGEVQRFIGRTASRPVARVDAIAKGVNYEAAVRVRLDANQLPKPFQIDALASREWQLASDWHRWSFAL